MSSYSNQTPKGEKRFSPASQLEKKPDSGGISHRSDNRTEAIAQRKLQTLADSRNANNTLRSTRNNTGLPDALKTGVEQLSGLSMNDVRVHYNSTKPVQMNALAFAQGTDIHLGPGQERHLPHEAWHVVQQKQGRVRPTLQMKSGVAINNDRGLEQEADQMGALALKSHNRPQPRPYLAMKKPSAVVQRMEGDYEKIAEHDGQEVTIEYEKGGEWVQMTGAVNNVLRTSLFIGTKRFAKHWVNDFDFKIVSLPHQEAAAGAGGSHYFMETGVAGARASVVLNTIRELISGEERIKKEDLIRELGTRSGLSVSQIKEAILLLRKHNVLFPAYPGPTLRSVKNFSLHSDYTEGAGEGGAAAADKSLTDFIKAIMEAQGITGGSMHDKVRNTLIHVIHSNPEDATWQGYRERLIALFKVPTAAQYYTDTYVRAGDEHEQLITSMTADQVLYDLEHPASRPVTLTGGALSGLEIQRMTNVPTNYIVLKSITKWPSEGDKVSQNHHPTAKKLISFADSQDSDKLHGSPGSGAGSSPAYHINLKLAIERNFGSLEALNAELAEINAISLAGRFDILGIPASDRVNQTYRQTNGTVLHFNNETELHKIARNVEIRRRKVLGLFKAVQRIIASSTDILEGQETLPRHADSDGEMDRLPATPERYTGR